MRKITIEIKDSDYLDFQSAANNSGLKVDVKLSEIIQYYISLRETERNSHNLHHSMILDCLGLPTSILART